MLSAESFSTLQTPKQIWYQHPITWNLTALYSFPVEVCAKIGPNDLRFGLSEAFETTGISRHSRENQLRNVGFFLRLEVLKSYGLLNNY